MTVAELAALVGGSVVGDGSVPVTGASGLRDARPGEVAFLSRARYAPLVEGTAAAALLVKEPLPGCRLPQVVVRDPEAAMTVAAAALAPPPVRAPAGIHPSAVVDPAAALGAGVSVGPLAVVEAGARVGDGTVLRAGSFVGRGASVGRDGLLHPGARVLDGVTVGDRAVIGASSVVGCDGYGFLPAGPGRLPLRVPHLGTVVVGDDVDIGACVTIARARFGRTTIGNGVKIDTHVHVAHNCHVGDGSLLVSQVGLAGSTVLGRGVIVGGQAGFAGHLEVGTAPAWPPARRSPATSPRAGTWPATPPSPTGSGSGRRPPSGRSPRSSSGSGGSSGPPERPPGRIPAPREPTAPFDGAPAAGR